MSALPAVPVGSGRHPIVMVAIAANELAASIAFYRSVFGWQLMHVAPDLASAALPSGPFVTLRANTPEGMQGCVPFVAVPDVAGVLETLVTNGATVERAPWSAPMMGTLARIIVDGTVYGLASAPAAPPLPVPAPFGDAPRPPAGSICSVELHAPQLDTIAAFVQTHFGWGTLPTMPQYCMFDPGAGIGGVFQSHTPANRGLAYIFVSDVATTLSAIRGAGGKTLGEPMAVPGMATFGYFVDPSGTAMGLLG